MPTCWIIAGPNGAGKTTFALEYLPTVANCTNFVNADLIAAGLFPLAPEKRLITTSRLFLNEINNHVNYQLDFGFETTLSGRGYLRLIRRLQQNSWYVELIYLALPSAEMSKLRVAERVASGGHSIPEKDITRRFPRSLHNLLFDYSSLVDHCVCFMNEDRMPIKIFEQNKQNRNILHKTYFQHILNQAKL